MDAWVFFPAVGKKVYFLFKKSEVVLIGGDTYKAWDLLMCTDIS